MQAGRAVHAAAAMELGADGVLVNTALAAARDPARMARAFRDAVEAGPDGLGGRFGRAKPNCKSY